MTSHRAIATLCGLLCSVNAWGDLDRPTSIDRVYVHPQSKQAALGLVTNYPLDQARDKLDAKLLTYTRYVESGKLYEQYPQVVRGLAVVVAFTVMVPPNAEARELLNSKKRVLEKQGFEVWVNVYDPQTKGLKRE